MAFENDHSKIAEMLIQKSSELNIDLNAKHRLFGRSTFHLACENGLFINLLISSSVDNHHFKTYSFSKSYLTLEYKDEIFDINKIAL